MIDMFASKGCPQSDKHHTNVGPYAQNSPSFNPRTQFYKKIM